MTTKLFGAAGPARARTRACSPAAAATSTTSATTRWPRRSCAARTPTPASSTSTSTDALDVEGVRRDLHLRGPRPAGSAEPLPLLIPHPALTHGRTGYAAGQGRGQPRRRGGRHGRRRRPLRRRGRRATGSGSTTSSCRPWSASTAARAGDAPRARRRARQRRARTWCRRSATPTAAIAAAPHTLDPRPDDRAQRLHADGGQGRLRPLGRRRAAAAACTPRPRPRPACAPPSPPSSACRSAKVECITPDVGGGFGVKIMHPWPEEVLVPVGGAGCSAATVKWTEDRREHFISSRPRARPGAARRGRLRRRRPAARPRRAVLARQRRLHAVRHHRPDHHLDPAARARTSRAPTGSSSSRSTPTPSS